MLLNRRLLRLLVHAVVLIVIVAVTVLLTDTYLDFLPSTIQSKLPLHTSEPVVIDIDIKTCLFGSGCPASGHDGWLRNDKDLYLGRSWTRHGYLYYRTAAENGLERGESVVIDAALSGVRGGVPQRVTDDVVENSIKVDISETEDIINLAHKLGWVQRNVNHGLWLKLGKHVPGHAVTQLNVLFGDDAVIPVPGWKVLDSSILGFDERKTDSLSPRLALRIGRQKFSKPSLTPRSGSSKFKIVQIADLHMVTGYGRCDQPLTVDAATCRADAESTKLVEATLDAENPDFVVYSGDQIFGSEAADPETALLKALAPTIKRKIPWAMVFGNHDDNGRLDNSQLMQIAEQLPYCLAEAGNVTGVGNYILSVHGAGETKANPVELTMYFLDSHSKLTGARQRGYSWIQQDQLDWLLDNSPPPGTLAMAWFHIPIPEFRASDRLRVGRHREAAMTSSSDLGTIGVLRELEISVLGVGHDHANDFCQYETGDKGDERPIWLCYGGGAGFGGYGGYPDQGGNVFARRLRIFEIDLSKESISSWERVEGQEGPIDHVSLVEGRKAIRPNVS